MDYLNGLEAMLQTGTDALWRSAKAMPEDKLDWRSAPTARTAREILQELPMTTEYTTKVLEAGKAPDFGDGGKAELDLAALEQTHRKAVAAFIEVAKQFPEDKLQDTVDLPWGKVSFFQEISYPYWNLVYHWGQISYIQTMYGDKQTH